MLVASARKLAMSSGVVCRSTTSMKRDMCVTLLVAGQRNGQRPRAHGGDALAADANRQRMAQAADADRVDGDVPIIGTGLDIRQVDSFRRVSTSRSGLMSGVLSPHLMTPQPGGRF